MITSVQDKETPLHYVAVSGNEDVLTEMLAHVPPSKVSQTLESLGYA